MAILTRADIEDADLPPGRRRLSRISRRIQQGEPVAPEDLKFIAEAFRAIADGADATKVLGVAGKQGQGRPAMSGAEFWRRWGRYIDEVEVLRRDQSITLEEALNLVATRRHLSVETLTRHHKRHGTTYRRARALSEIIGPMAARTAALYAEEEAQEEGPKTA